MITVDRIIDDAEFGHIYIRQNARAVRYTYRAAHDGSDQCGILVTVPQRYVLKDVLRSVEQMRPELKKLIIRANPKTVHPANPRIDLQFHIQADCIDISLVQGTLDGFYLHTEAAQISQDAQGEDVILKPAIVRITCPPNCDFEAEERQSWLQNVIVEQVRAQAKEQLIPRLKSYASAHDIAIREVKINSSKGRWGSCVQRTEGSLFTRRKYHVVNLSLFTLLLPMALQRLVLLHELTHTRHMDHSPAFHHDLDQWLEGQEARLNAQLKRYSTSIFSFVTR